MHRSESGSDQSIDYWAWVAFAIMAICMSLSFVFVGLSLEGFSSIQSAAGRIVIGAGFLVPLAFVLGDGLPMKLWFWKWAAALGIVNFVLPFSMSTYGQTYLPSNIVGAMFSLIPLVTIGLSAAFLQVHVSRRKLVGIFIGFLGLVVIAEPGKWVGSTGLEHAVPMMATLGAIICLASTAILIRLMPRVHPLSLMGGSALVASLFGIVPFLSIFDGDLPSIRPWIGLLGGAFLSTTIALSIRFYLIRRKGPIFLAPNAYIGVILVNVFGVSVLGDDITLAMMIAFPLILLGLFIAQDGTGNMKQV